MVPVAEPGAPGPSVRWLLLIGALLVAAAALAHIAYYFPRTVDDMFIHLRYAENLASGNGLVYNLGERVEGFSSPMWVPLIAVGIALGFNGVTFSKLVSLAFLGFLLWGLYKLGREQLKLGPLSALLPPACCAANSYIIAWSTWGLETPAYLSLMVWSAVWLGRHIEEPSRRRLLVTSLVCGLFALTRPEAALFLALIGLALVVRPAGFRHKLAALGRGIAPGLIVIAVFGAYTGFRMAYFGLPLPHTYYAKQGHGFNWMQWQPLWAQGAATSEILFVFGGALLAAVTYFARRSVLALAVFCGSLFFVASVLLDWMPNHRHFLPMWVFFPLGWAWLVDQGWRWRGKGALQWVGLVLIGFALVTLSWTAWSQLRIDSRYSPNDFATHGRGEHWVRPKSLGAWSDTWDCLTRRTPDHVARMHPYHMGMLAQVFRAIEADARPLDETWYVGRDIGRVGYLTPIQMYDTDGLFTPDIVQSDEWLADGTVTTELIESAFDRPVVMTELIGPWHGAVRGNRELRRQYPAWQPGNTWHLRNRDSQPPTHEQVWQRYLYAEERMPSSYYVMTLYGEAVGAAFDRRMSDLRGTLGEEHSAVIGSPPDGLPGPTVTLDQDVELLGCTATPNEVERGESFELLCYFRRAGDLARQYEIFVHLESLAGVFRINADHPPASFLLPTNRWPEGQVVRDAINITIPSDMPIGTAQVRMGLFSGNHRAVIEPAEFQDGENRTLGPVITVR